MTIDDVLLIIIIAGLGLSVAYLRAEYVLYRGFKAAQHKKVTVQGPARRKLGSFIGSHVRNPAERGTSLHREPA